MALSDTLEDLQELLTSILIDLEKVKKGNKTAAQRVRTRTICLEKIGLLFRKESIGASKTNSLKKNQAKAKTKKKS